MLVSAALCRFVLCCAVVRLLVLCCVVCLVAVLGRILPRLLLWRVVALCLSLGAVLCRPAVLPVVRLLLFLVPCFLALPVSWRPLCGAVLVCLRRCCLCGTLLPLWRWCFVLLPVVFGCLLLGLAIPCSLLVGPGGSRCPVSVVCCGVSLGAVLRRLLGVVPPGLVLLCAVLFCFALIRAVVRCVVTWGAVRRPGVLCLPALCFGFSPCTVCVFPWCVAACCCSPLCFVPCVSCAVVLCVPCPLRPVWCCYAALLSLGGLPPCAVPRGVVLPCGAVVSCPAALFVTHAEPTQGDTRGFCLPFLAARHEHLCFPICTHKNKGLPIVLFCIFKTYGCGLAQLIIKRVSWEAA